MKIIPFLNNIVTSPARSRNKTAVLKEVSQREQHNLDVVNIHRIDRNNVGDFFCAPHHYFDQLQNKYLDIYDIKQTSREITNKWIESVSNNSLIIGGGGILNRGSFDKQMKLFHSLVDKNKKTVLWGAGHNSKNPAEFGKVTDYNLDVNKFGVVGTRDYQLSKTHWVPCVSCLHPVFDKEFTVSRELGVVLHKKTLRRRAVTFRFKDLPITSNTADLDSLITFIGSSETIITDSYHAMYWSILLGRKVVVVPNSSKFFDFKYMPVISTFDSCIADAGKAREFSGVLEECREINLKFAEKVFNYLEL